MGNMRKRIEAIHEMYMSEKAYINDMILWDTEFRKCILEFRFLSVKIKYEICDTIFINMTTIREFHQKIFEEMKKYNLRVRLSMDPFYIQKDSDEFCIDKSKYDDHHVASLEYASIFQCKEEALKHYQEYMSRLPKAEFELERLCHYSNEFKEGLQNFLVANKIEYLGVRNFLYRPSTKMARVSLLLKAIMKNEINPDYIAKYDILIRTIQMSTESIDKILMLYSGQFKMYWLSKNLKYAEQVKNPLELGLYQKNRKLIKEGEVLLRYDILLETGLVKMYIFDHAIIFCEISNNQFNMQCILYEPIFANRAIVFLEDLGFDSSVKRKTDYFPVFILETSENRIRTLYFKDKEVREVYYNIIRKIIYNNKRLMRDDIKVCKLRHKFSETLSSACTSTRSVGTEVYEQIFDQHADSSESNSVCDDESADVPSDELAQNNPTNLFKKKEIQRAMSEYTSEVNKNKISTGAKSYIGSYGNYYDDSSSSEKESDAQQDDVVDVVPNCIQRIFFGNDVFSRVTTFEIDSSKETDTEYLRKNMEMVILSTPNCIYKIIDNQSPTKLYHVGSTKIMYDAMYELLMYKSMNTLYVAKLNCQMDRIDPKIVKNNIGDFFYGSNNQGSYIATRNAGADKSSLVYLFSVSKNNGIVTVDLARKLYVGFKVYNIVFDLENIIVACNEFETVNLDTLKTEEFLERYDQCMPIIFKVVPYSRAMNIFKISKKLFLVCFNTIGFYADDFGRINNTKIIFLWKSKPVAFKLYFTYLICLSKKWIDIFDIENGKLIFSDQIYKLKFVNGTHDIILHDNECMYKVVI